VAAPGWPINSVAELIAYARAHPGKINFASPGHGTPPHMAGEMFRLRAGIEIVHVPYKGTAAALTDIMSGQVEITFENPSVTVPLVQAGKVKGLAVTGESRNPQIPDAPTMIESGLPDFVSTSFTRPRWHAGRDRRAAQSGDRPGPALARDDRRVRQARRRHEARIAGRVRRLRGARARQVGKCRTVGQYKSRLRSERCIGLSSPRSRPP